ncbi:nucleotide sugar dehydrogenase [Psychrobacter sp. I-STPA6b]|uniref:nucleotide sugar dehydrogenase n=1 Tax=Psychrobacter sp. I-STPA6b TaxID=2585718 RepID=UPI001D0BF642|nr:nucleotide sugar dehydrogenase [Psychrobacter sp. I-STPA6b]
MQTQLIEKIKSKKAVVGIIGLGYVGLPLMLRYTEVGYQVLGFDIDKNKVDLLNSGKSYIEHIEANVIERVVNNKLFNATIDFSRITECDVIILCVPTPLNKHREPDISFVIDTTKTIKPYIRAGQLISLESTTYPGTTEEELVPRLEHSSLVVGKDIFLVYSPEREDPGNINFETRTIPKVVGGCTPSCVEVGVIFYGQAIDNIVPVSSTRVAEMTKLLENIHRAVNIGLVNEMKIVADRMGIDIFEVIDAAATKPFGFTPYYPGPGLGGHCIPIDPFYLTWKAREYGVHTRFIELAGEVNRSMPEFVVAKVMDGLNEIQKSLKGASILVLGIAYKKNVDDMRESPAVEIMEILREKGAMVSYSDPHVAHFPKMREHHFDLSSQEITAENLKKFDAVLLTTDHDKFDYQLIYEHAKMIIDTRGKYREDQKGTNTRKVIKA